MTVIFNFNITCKFDPHSITITSTLLANSIVPLSQACKTGFTVVDSGLPAMGKSPGKWIKTVLLGKKQSKSSISKEESINKFSDDRAENPSVVSTQAPHTPHRSGETSEPETGISENLTNKEVVSLPGPPGAHIEGTLELDSLYIDEIAMQAKAAIKAQAAFRGYLARRAFHALKGIIVLQSLIRGDLVRRQAIANLLCKQGHLVSHHAEPVPEQSQNEIERVRQNLRKVSVSSTVAPKRKASPRKVSRPTISDVPQKGVQGFTEKKSAAVVPVLKCSEEPGVQSSPNSHTAEKTLDVLDGVHCGVELYPPENGDEVEKADPMMDEELNFKEDDQTNNENQRTKRTRRSWSVKQEYQEKASQNSPTLPSYMAATESLKAKLRSQAGSPRFGHDGVENGFYGQDSLPSSTNGRPSSLISSQTQKLAQKNGRGGSKTYKSKLSSGEGHEKAAQAGWKR